MRRARLPFIGKEALYLRVRELFQLRPHALDVPLIYLFIQADDEMGGCFGAVGGVDAETAVLRVPLSATRGIKSGLSARRDQTRDGRWSPEELAVAP
jgi:hypothetical protein